MLAFFRDLDAMNEYIVAYNTSMFD